MFKGITCKIKGHDLETESIIKEISGDCWCKRCKRCGRYVLHAPIGSICTTEKEALEIKKDFEKEMEWLEKFLKSTEGGGTDE